MFAIDLKDWNTRGLIFVGLVMLALLFAGPQIFDLFVLLKVILFISTAMLALSMGFIWGFGGILCFGQSAFFGIGGYAYAIAVINMGESTVPLLLSVFVPAAFAMLLGYFMFYGRLSDIYLAVVTLAVTLIFYAFIRSTSGEEYAIGWDSTEYPRSLASTGRVSLTRSFGQTIYSTLPWCFSYWFISVYAICCVPISAASLWLSGKTKHAPNI